MMPNAICGHDREALRKALEFANTADLDGISRGWPRPDDAYGALLFDVHDPAKLAAIIADLLWERKFDATIISSKNIVISKWTNNVVANRWFLEMPYARRLALALLDAPNATAQDAERMIGDVTR